MLNVEFSQMFPKDVLFWEAFSRHFLQKPNILESLDIWTHVFPFAHAFQRYMTALGTPTNPNTKDKNHMWQSDKVKNLSKEVLNLGHHCRYVVSTFLCYSREKSICRGRYDTGRSHLVTIIR